MFAENSFDLIQQEVKKLINLRESYNNMINEKDIISSSIENYYKYKILFIIYLYIVLDN